ncbi:hypothetical protein QBC33DRAFT_623954 [Phialemonium atrogriseum]|uniref:Uncharacterized protein n=1 Tax=Phialemonium atrogriseum TaxID=1093897 RepID=A0AAJ0BQ17_9PEZI|nr:uncharacterized protein QBC33DRAFT_623954 [Phialemonium atrogriseum]KAK1762115.1 hypothetical protein QBC33DRAFT_623954 [Phialemonium atrogriseum]
MVRLFLQACVLLRGGTNAKKPRHSVTMAVIPPTLIQPLCLHSSGSQREQHQNWRDHTATIFMAGHYCGPLDSIQSLRSAILSHSSLYVGFRENPDRVISDILNGQMSPETMVYAIAAYEANSIDSDDKEQIEDFLMRWFDFAGPDAPGEYYITPGEQDPSVASALSRTHTIVQYFTRDLVQDTLPLSREELGLERSDHTRASPSEVFRIHRALYRFQGYCNLFFRDEKEFCPDRERTSALCALLHVYFFGLFSTWVNEQLACVHDYLERVLSRAFDDVAAHDVQWGFESVDWLSKGKANEHKQAYDWTPEHLNDLRRWGTDGPVDGIKSGPFRMWLEAHKGFRVRDAVYHEEHPRLRRCGYVLWDAPDPPIDEKVLRGHFLDARRQGLLDYLALNGARDKMNKSWTERAAIYESGGRGYWNEGDLSQVVWSEGASQVAMGSSMEKLRVL